MFMINKTMLTKRLKHKKSGKFITRIRTRNLMPCNPEEFKEPGLTYFDRIAGEKSILGSGERTALKMESVIASKKASRCKTNLADIADSLKVRTRGDRLHSQQGDSILKSELMRQIRSSNRVTIRDKKNQRRIQEKIEQTTKFSQQTLSQNRPQYMSYAEYEQLLGRQLIKPTHFQSLAKLNDQKYEQELEVLNHFRKQGDSVHEKGNKKILDSFESSLEVVPRKVQKGTLVERSDFVEKHSASTIINTKLGALSNGAVLQILEDKWDEEQRHHPAHHVVWTEESEGISESDTKHGTIRQEVKLKNTVGRKNRSKNQSIQERKDLLKVKDDKVRFRLQKILKTERQGFSLGSLEAYSCGRQYAIQEQSLLKFKDIYRVKKFQINHKFDWRI